MEPLLLVALSNLSSCKPVKIRRGLRQVEGLLAQICLSFSSLSQSIFVTSEAPARDDLAPPSPDPSLTGLSEDPAYHEFYRLQESFEWNVCMRLVGSLERLLGIRRNTETDQLIIASLHVLTGLLLLHPPSRSIFRQDIYMNTLLDLLEPQNSPDMLETTISVLTAATLNRPSNFRTFEAADGLHSVTTLLQAKGPSESVRASVSQFLHSYLLPEGITEELEGGSASSREAGEVAATGSSWGSGSSVDSLTKPLLRTTREKQELLDHSVGQHNSVGSRRHGSVVSGKCVVG